MAVHACFSIASAMLVTPTIGTPAANRQPVAPEPKRGADAGEAARSDRHRHGVKFLPLMVGQ